MPENIREIIDHVHTTGSRWTITRDGKPVAYVLSADEYESLAETLDVLSDDGTMAALTEAQAETGTWQNADGEESSDAE